MAFPSYPALVDDIGDGNFNTGTPLTKQWFEDELFAWILSICQSVVYEDITPADAIEMIMSGNFKTPFILESTSSHLSGVSDNTQIYLRASMFHLAFDNNDKRLWDGGFIEFGSGDYVVSSFVNADYYKQIILWIVIDEFNDMIFLIVEGEESATREGVETPVPFEGNGFQVGSIIVQNDGTIDTPGAILPITEDDIYSDGLTIGGGDAQEVSTWRCDGIVTSDICLDGVRIPTYDGEIDRFEISLGRSGYEFAQPLFQFDEATSSEADNAGWTLRLRPTSKSHYNTITNNPNRIAVELKAGSTGCEIDSVYIGPWTNTTDPDYLSTPQQLLFSGDPGVSIEPYCSVVSDLLVHTFDSSLYYMVSFYISDLAETSSLGTLSLDHMLTYWKETEAVDDAATLSTSGYTQDVNGDIVGLQQIYLLNSADVEDNTDISLMKNGESLYTENIPHLSGRRNTYSIPATSLSSLRYNTGDVLNIAVTDNTYRTKNLRCDLFRK